MAAAQLQPNLQEQQPGSSLGSKVAKSLLALLAMVLVIVGLVFLIRHYGSKTSSLPQTAEDIRKLFTPPTPSAPSPKAVISTPAPQPLPIVVPPAPQTQLYQNPALGFKLELDDGWQLNHSASQIVVFINPAGQSLEVQVYWAGSETLSDVLAQLQGSPSVSQLSQTNFAGQPALEFKTARGWGAAIIYNNRLYYIMAPSLYHLPASSFAFLN